ncbi:MAG: hypothetical protein ABFS35_00425 [Bacteroidota bacterium]
MSVEKLSITIGGITVLEPMVTFTDIIVSAVCFYIFYKLYKTNKQGKMYFYFEWHFFTMGVATILGGLFGHGFTYAVDVAWKLPGWIISMISVTFMERAFIEHSVKYIGKKTEYFLKMANIIKLILFTGLTVYTLNFHFVEFHSGFGILAVALPLQLFMYIKTRDPGSKYVFIMVGLSLLSGFTFLNEIIIHKWFNHMALSHVFIVVMVFCLYKAALNLQYSQNPTEKATE